MVTNNQPRHPSAVHRVRTPVLRSVEVTQEAHTPHTAAIRTDICIDIRNVTDLEPVMMISEVPIG